MTRVRIEFALPEFFSAHPRKLSIEDAGTGRVYFLLKDRIVAVGVPR